MEFHALNFVNQLDYEGLWYTKPEFTSVAILLPVSRADGWL